MQFMRPFVVVRKRRKMTTRQEHIEWSRARALEYLDAGDIMTAVTSMMSDLEKHPATKVNNATLYMLGVVAVNSGDPAEARRFIEGFR